MDDKKMLELYTLAELAYIKHFENKIEDKEYLFPGNWYESKNYRLKIEIITEAIKNNILIEYTQKYQDIIEGVKRTLVKE